MELRHLRYFVTLAELLNFTKAASRLHVAQPSLSRQIRDLEDELGVRLLERSTRSVQLTAAGKDFIIEAKAVLQRAEAAMHSAKAFAKGDRGEINLGFAPSLTVELLPRALKAFEKVCPHVRVNLHDLSIQQMFHGIRAGKLHVALTIDPLPRKTPDVIFESLRTYPFCVAVDNAHRFSRLKIVSAEDILLEPLVVYSREEFPEYHERLRAVFDGRLRSALVRAEEHDCGSSLIAAIEAGRGVAIVPSIMASAAGSRLKLLAIDPNPESLHVGILYHREHQNPAAARFVATVVPLRKKMRTRDK